MTAAQIVHELMRDLKLAPQLQDVSWSATTSDWRNPIEQAVEDFADPECWAALEQRCEAAEDGQREAEDKCEELENDNAQLELEIDDLKKRIKELEASAAE